MEEQYRCMVFKYDPEDDYKQNAVIVLAFEFEVKVFRNFVKKLLGSNSYFPFLSFLPLTSVEFIDNKFGKFPGFYYGALTNQATVEFIDRYNFVIHFQNGYIKGWMEEKDFVRWEVQGASEFFDGNLSKQLILTNYWNVNQSDSLTETYLISIGKTIKSQN
ncbi:hypothetical protein NYE70_22060 [Paenibacillus sp. FSL R5-0407]|uniref:hypothetical protein n=1 Tax=Paenibacillus sp. FSL R5-0407 TaxID=2975320 RepID=UPI0030FB72CD